METATCELYPEALNLFARNGFRLWIPPQFVETDKNYMWLGIKRKVSQFLACSVLSQSESGREFILEHDFAVWWTTFAVLFLLFTLRN